MIAVVATATVTPTVGALQSPGFGALIALIGLGAVIWILLRKRSL